MNEPKMCCNCLHCARWKRKNGIECHCDLTDEYLGYLQVMNEENDCKHWEKETKWDLQRKHDSDLIDKVAEKIKSEMIEDYPPNINGIKAPTPFTHFSYNEMCKILDKVIAELKAEVSEDANEP